MKRKHRRNIVCCLLLLLLSLVALGCNHSPGKTAATEKKAIPYSELQGLPEAEQIEKILQSLTLTEKLGQMMMIGIEGKTVDENVLYQLHQFHFGGVILFDRNLESDGQVRRLTKELQGQSKEKLPLFIALDEEGGKVVRMPEILPPPPAQLEIGFSGRPELAEQYAAATAKKMRELGLNVNFAPVADLGDGGRHGTRYYSKEAAVATEFVQAAARGYSGQKLYFALKHFPGIGKGRADTHQDSVVIQADKAELLADDLLPFQQIVAEQPAANYFMMVSHSTYPAVAGDKPASLSPEIMQGLLRDELGYQGVVITDDMEMGAVSKYHSKRELGLLAVQAGADIVLVCHEYEAQTEAYLGLLEAVQDGRLSEERVNESVRRIIKMKLKYLLGAE